MSESRLMSLVVESPPPVRTIAVRVREGKSQNEGPGLFWLGGFKSDMQGTKAGALDGLGEILTLVRSGRDPLTAIGS